MSQSITNSDPASNLILSDDSLWQAADGVLFCDQGGSAALLSTVTQSYFTLNPSGSVIWNRFVGGAAIVEVVRDYQAVFDISETQAADDVRAFARELVAGGLLTRATEHRRLLAPAPLSMSRTADKYSAEELPSIWRVAATLLAVTLMLRLAGLPRTLRWVEAEQTRRTISPRDLPCPLRAKLAMKTRWAAAWLPLRVACLEQSLTILAILKRAGVDSSLRLGVHPYPFSAHAWVESGGEPVNETAETLLKYRVLQPVPSQR